MVGTWSELIVEALFLSDLQPSERPSVGAARAAVKRSLLRHGREGCAAAAAAEFFDHLDTAVPRMCWARGMAAEAFPTMCLSKAPVAA
ncbi:hypothetical protein [Pilimelia columellifera]|uniref:Uncharacterized protein n=1 Tax=Pilimelia columellifera subsp. columellifera TaxID=706583 RepID=A0ABN3NP13_9ACTN